MSKYNDKITKDILPGTKIIRVGDNCSGVQTGRIYTFVKLFSKFYDEECGFEIVLEGKTGWYYSSKFRLISNE